MLIALALTVAACAGEESPETSTTSTTAPSTTSSTVQLPTAAEILADGEVTDEERGLARRAVYECVVDAGADTTFDLFDVDPVVKRDFGEEYDACFVEYKGLVVERLFPGDRFDFGLLGVVECTEDHTGKYYGPKTLDEIGRLTDESRDTIENALNADEVVYEDCHADLFPNEVGIVEFGTIIEYRFDDGDPKRISLKVEDCGYLYGGRLVEETDSTVIVDVVTRHEGHGRPCWIRHPVRLKAPLGDRVVIDEATGDEILQEMA